jgi:MOSC domain-containing protein YiiM
MSATIRAVCTSPGKGERKKDVGRGLLVVNSGEESIDKMRAAGLDVGPGDFAENLTTHGIELFSLPLGTRLAVGSEALLEVTQIGKECHTRCAIFYQAGDCVMPKEGIFARVLRGGNVQRGDRISVVPAQDPQ